MGYTTLNKDEKEEEKKVLILFTPTFLPFGQEAVSYTHLDVYKRQRLYHLLNLRIGIISFFGKTGMAADLCIVPAVLYIHSGNKNRFGNRTFGSTGSLEGFIGNG